MTSLNTNVLVCYPVKDDAAQNAIASKFIDRPTAKFDTIPITTGPQVLGKSSFLEYCLQLELRSWLFTGSLNLADRDDEMFSLCHGRAIIEAYELSGFFGRKLASVKQWTVQ
ncbi:MAG: hypothetical protein F4100_02590 [Rhodothermaceae bacterium]|nr:hypothetical protein [Rhodothermaceae bacterium]MYE63680.1 hypothetical protein [Rhodothermaceae bacterium]MYJ19622.1 hypothetical protein [Rhodothermaceae bacterium]